MGQTEDYNEKVDFQLQLDELFPRGAYVTMMSEGRNVGTELITARVFCDGVRFVDGVWEHHVMIDPRQDELPVGEFAQPYAFWMTEFDLEGLPLVEAEEIQEDDDDPEKVVRLDADPQGPRKPRRGSRAFLSALREPELFPRGVKPVELEVVADG